MKNIDVYTDGACSGNPGPGGWGVLMICQGTTKEMSGYQPSTTNNRMEMFAAIQGLSALKESCQVRLFSDSSYLLNAFTKGWLDNWQRNGWKTASRSPVENQDLWKLLLIHTQRHQMEFVKVKGHSDNPYNNRCDELARLAIRQQRDLE